jgi:hypothetical protein
LFLLIFFYHLVLRGHHCPQPRIGQVACKAVGNKE